MVNTVVYFIDDDVSISPFIMNAKMKKLFPDSKILSSGQIDRAIDWCQLNENRTVFVIDSYMPLSEKIKKTFNLNEKNMECDPGRSSEHLCGVYGAAILKSFMSNSKVILLTAYASIITKIEDENSDIKLMIEKYVDKIISKNVEPDLIISSINHQLSFINDDNIH